MKNLNFTLIKRLAVPAAPAIEFVTTNEKVVRVDVRDSSFIQMLPKKLQMPLMTSKSIGCVIFQLGKLSMRLLRKMLIQILPKKLKMTLASIKSIS